MKAPAIQICLDNFINGNLTTAKEQAKRFSALKLIRALIEGYGYSLNKANMTAFYLKGEVSFQEACHTK